MDSFEKRRKSKRLSEKSINCNQINDKKNKIKCKSNIKSVKLKENDTNVRKCCRNSRFNGITEVISVRKYGLRKLSPINWKERLDTRHITNDNKVIDSKHLEKTKTKNLTKFEDRNVHKIKDKTNNKIVDKINGKINSKSVHKINGKSIELTNNKKTKKRKTNKIYDKSYNEVNDKINKIKSIQNINNKTDGDIDSTENSSDLCPKIITIEPQIQESNEQLVKEEKQISDNITYFEYLEKSSNSEPTVPSLSLNIIINLFKHKNKMTNKTKHLSKRNARKSEVVNKKRRLYSCGYDLCDSGKCQNMF